MKKLVLFIFVLGYSVVKSQLPPDLKYDNLLYSHDSSTVLIQKGKLSSVYNLQTQKMAVAPTKNPVLNFHGSNNYAEVLTKTNRLCIHVISGETHKQVFSSTDTCYIGFPSPADQSNLVDFNGLISDQVSMDTVDLSYVSLDWKKYEVVKCSNEIYILNSYFKDLVYHDGQDQMQYTPGLTNSGVYNADEKKWLVDPRYQSCHFVNGYLFCLNADRKGTYFVEDGIATIPETIFTYDLYEVTANSATRLLSHITQVDLNLVTQILNVESVELTGETGLYLTNHDNKKGLVWLQLMEPRWPDNPSFVYREFLPPTADLVVVSPGYDLFAAIYTGEHAHVDLYKANFYQDWYGHADYGIPVISGKTLAGFKKSDQDYYADEYYYSHSVILKSGYADTLGNLGLFAAPVLTDDRSQFSISVTGQDLAVINNFQRDFYDVNVLMSRTFPGEDSTTLSGDPAIVAEAEIKGYTGSGVCQISTGRWLIEPSYEQVYSSGNLFFCLGRTFTPEYGQLTAADFDNAYYGTYPLRYDYYYDVYEMQNGNAVKIQSNLTGNKPELITNLTGQKLLHTYTDGEHFLMLGPDGISLYRFHLFQSDLNDRPEFAVDPVFERKFDFIAFSPELQKAICYVSDTSKNLLMYDIHDTYEGGSKIISSASDHLAYSLVEPGMNYTPYIIADTTIYEVFTNDSKLIDSLVEIDYFFSRLNLAIREWNDSLILVTDFSEDKKNLHPLRSTLYLDEDSVDENYNIVYPPPTPGFCHSGVYNLNSRNWLIAPEYYNIRPTGNGFLAQGADRNNAYGTFSEINYTVFNQSAQKISGPVSAEELLDHPEYLTYLSGFSDVDSVFKVQNGFTGHTLLQSKARHAFYIVSGDKLGLYLPDEEFINELQPELYEFVHYHGELEFMFYLLGDSIFFTSPYGNASVSKKGKLIYLQHDFNLDPLYSYQILAVENGDTTVHGEFRPGYYSTTTASIEIKNDRLIINDHTETGDQSCYECYDSFGNMGNHTFLVESENSSVWKKESSGWRKISPNYASIHPVSNGWYIASCGQLEDKWELYESVPQNQKSTDISIQSRYFLLDSGFHAIPYLDYFDFPDAQDLGFGIKIKLDNGNYFFMAYDGTAVTNADWDHFELEDGKLKAIVHAVYQFDYYGNPVLDEYGVPIEVVPQKVHYFDLP